MIFSILESTIRCNILCNLLGFRYIFQPFDYQAGAFLKRPGNLSLQNKRYVDIGALEKRAYWQFEELLEEVILISL